MSSLLWMNLLPFVDTECKYFSNNFPSFCSFFDSFFTRFNRRIGVL